MTKLKEKILWLKKSKRNNKENERQSCYIFRNILIWKNTPFLNLQEKTPEITTKIKVVSGTT